MSRLPEVAECFQSAGITALIYDPRSIGESDGMPRNDIDPYKQVEDFSDAVTYLVNQPEVDREQVSAWGISLSGAIALCAAALDDRIKSTIAVCPAVEYTYDKQKIAKVLTRCRQDRESQAKTNPPFYIPTFNASGENPAGFEFGYERERAARIFEAGVQLAPNHVNRTTVQSYYRLLAWNPSHIWKAFGTKPVFFIIPENDVLCPPDVQMRHLEAFQGPKKFYLQKDRGHMDVLDGENFEALVNMQMDFMRGVWGGEHFAESSSLAP